MKKVVVAMLVVVLVFSLNSCKEKASSQVKEENVEMAEARENTAPSSFPVLTFEEKEYDFGNIQRGTAVEHIFKFTNTGKVPLVIQKATSSCGCTIPQVPLNEPIAPGESGEMLVKYNGSGSNQITKIVTVTANTESGTETVKIKAFVETDTNAKLNPGFKISE